MAADLERYRNEDPRAHLPRPQGSTCMIPLYMYHMVIGGWVPLYTCPQVKRGSCHLQKGFFEATCLSVAS